jgi:hypothetical protein
MACVVLGASAPVVARAGGESCGRLGTTAVIKAHSVAATMSVATTTEIATRACGQVERGSAVM